MKRKYPAIALATAICVLTAEAQAATKATVAAGPKPVRLGSVIVSGSIRSRFESWNWFEPTSGENQYGYSGNIFRLMMSQSKEQFGWQVEVAVPVLLGLPDNATGPGVQGGLGLGANYFGSNDRRRNNIMLFPKQVVGLWKGLGGNGAVLKAGRFEFADGSELTPKNATLAAIKNTRINMRLLGHFGWTHVGRSFDGAHYSRNSITKGTTTGNLTFVGAIPTRGVFQTDGWGWNNVAFGYLAYTKSWGKGIHTAETRILGLHYHDWRRVLKGDNRTASTRAGDLGNLRIATFGGHSIHAVDTKKAGLDLMFWGVAQTGKWGRLDHRAYAVDVEGGVQPKAKVLASLRPWLRLGQMVSSGDSDPTDQRHGSFFQVMPTPRPFARFPFFNMMNNRDLYAGLTLRPKGRFSFSSEFHSLALRSRSDLWYAGGGVFQPWSFGYQGRSASGAKSLANLYDLSVDLKVNAATSFNFYYGYAQGLAAMKAIYPKGQGGHFGYIELMYRF